VSSVGARGSSSGSGSRSEDAGGVTGAGTAAAAALVDRVGFRGPALAGVLVVTFAYASVMYHVTDVVGGTGLMVLVVFGMLGLATGLSRLVGVRGATAVAALVAAGGAAVYFGSIPSSQLALVTVDRLVSDAVALVTGLSVLRLTEANVWALAVTPAPVFLSWHLAMRERYVASVAVGWLALGFLVLTGDAGQVVTLGGVIGSVLAVGFGTLARQGGTDAQVDTIAVLIAAMVVLSVSLSVVPAAAGSGPLIPDRGTTTVEASLVSADDRVSILGSIRLSPSVRFTVESDEGRYWQTAAYDRYESSGWVRTGETQAYTDRLADPPGAATTIEQTVRPETQLDAMPAAWKPVSVTGDGSSGAGVTPQGNFRPGDTIATGDSYTVVSRAPRYTSEQLRRAGTDYPAAVEGYFQLPGSVSDRVRERATAVAGNESNAYDKAVAIEEYLESNKRYSLTVERPDGEIADSFLFEMDAGYCTYYATTMVVMLRSEGVPARFVTGYTTGQSVGDGEYVVRGLDSHAWVQVYFPDVGWVNFDPTPSTARETAETTRLTEARENEVPGVDTADSSPDPTPTEAAGDPAVSGNRSLTPQVPGTPGADNLPTNASNASQATPIVNQERLGITDTNGTAAGGSGGFSLPEPPDRETLGFMLVVLVGLAAGARRTGLSKRAADALALRIQRGDVDPEAAVDRAYDRLETLLQRRYRARRPGETPRAYVAALSARGLDDRAKRVADVYERARYAEGVSESEATEAVETVDRLAWEATPLVGRLLT
jgi:transglutaminase-like putative cysteine protease